LRSARRIGAVARHEFIGTVTRIGYLITLFGMPLFVGALSGLSAIMAWKSQEAQSARTEVVGVVDESGLFAKADLTVPDAPPPPLARMSDQLGGQKMQMHGISHSGKLELRRMASLQAGKDALLRGELESVVRIPQSYLRDGRVEELVRPPKGLKMGGLASRLRPWLVRGLLEARVEPAIAARAALPLDVETLMVEPDGRTAPEDLVATIKPFAVPLGFSLLLMLSIFTSASYLATGLSEEKQNRALEMLLTSLTPEQLFWGKLLGIGGAALVQFLIYLLLVALPSAVAFRALGLSLAQAGAGLAYFVLGFFFFGSCLLAVGAIGNTQKYTQQLSGLFTFTAIVPLMMLTPILDQPQGALARTLTYVPFTAPITGMLRAGAGALPWWELLLSLCALALGCVLAVKSCAKIFRLALLATGTTPGLKQVWSWLRA
jgi:ABC-2 type transport system permease protein